MRPASWIPLFAVALLLAFSGTARADAVAPLFPAGELPRLGAKGATTSMELPLRHTAVSAKVVGPAARVEVTQVYENPASEPIEAIYVFPLPENAAVDDFELRVADRVIKGEIQERSAARRTYEDAKAAGNTAALLEQERPNVFTQSIANLPPGEEIHVVVRYAQTLAYDDGYFEFAFPMVVGPRYVPGRSLHRPNRGLGAVDDTDAVPDASRISPFVLPRGMRSGHDVSIDVSVEPGLTIRDLQAPTHQIAAASLDDHRLAIRLLPGDAIPNRDFILRWSVEGRLPTATLLTHRGERGGFFTLVVQPPELDVEAEIGRREIIFVVDNSGSMHGVPIWLCQEAMYEALGRLRPVDTFNVITFAGSTAQAFERPLQATRENTDQALGFVAGMRAGGGTRMLGAIEAALAPEVEAGRSRHVFLLTDGFVGNEAQLIGATRQYVSALEAKGQRGRVFGFGVGSSPNRHLLEGISTAGKGATVYATNREDPLRAVMLFFKKIDRAILEDVSIDWGGLNVTELSPSPMPDLFASRPLVVHGRFQGAGEAKVTVRGYADGRKVEIPVRLSLPAEPHGEAVVASLWARSRVADLLRQYAYERVNGPDDGAQTRARVLELGLAYRLVTPYTSFVAVDRSRRVSSGATPTVLVPIEVPEDVDVGVANARTAVKRAGLLGSLHAAPAPGDLGGVGGLGFRGTGYGGGGLGGGTALGSKDAYGSAGVVVVGRGMAARKKAVVPIVIDSAATVRGTMSGDTIGAVVRRRSAELRYCHEKAAGSPSAFTGRLVFRLTIGADGQVLKVELTEGKPSELLEGCLLRRMRSWRFPSGSGQTVVVIPVRFDAAR